MDTVLQDVRYAFRHLRRSPGFSFAAILMLALGVGANTATFCVLNALVLRPLAVADPDTLVGVSSYGPDGVKRLMLNPVVEELEKEGPFAPICAINGGGIFAAEVNGAASQTSIAVITGRCFDVFGIQPLLGRTITADDAPMFAPGKMVAVIGHRFWSRMFGGDRAAIGKTIKMEGAELTVIGVMPPGFGGLQADVGTDIYVPNYTITPMRPDRPAGSPQLIGRLKPGVAMASAQAELSARWPAILQKVVPATLPAVARDAFIKLEPRVESLGGGLNFYRDRYARSMRLIFALTAILTLLAALNLGGLLLTRLTARSTEIGVRLALGSSGARLAQQMLLEGTLLSIIGAALGVPLALLFVRVLASYVPNPLVDNSLDFSIDTRVLILTAAFAIMSAVVMTSLPIWVAWRQRRRLLAVTDRTVLSNSSRWARVILVVQIALSMVMVTAAGLLSQSLSRLYRVNPGVRIENRLIAGLMPLPNAYRTINNASYYPALLDQVRSLHGVTGVGLARIFPRNVSEMVGQPIALTDAAAPEFRAQLESASPGYFETLGVPLLQGRLPLWTDLATTQQVAVVSESLARKLDTGGDVIGRHVRFGTNPADQNVEIVGVVGNMSLGNLRQTDFPIFFRPTLQAGLFANYPRLIVASDGDAMALAPAIAAIVKQPGREYVHNVNTLQAIFRDSPSNERMSATLAGIIAVLAAALAVVGVYSLLAYGVARRTREIGVRVALGARRREILTMVVRAGLLMKVLGFILGAPAAAAASTLLRSMLFGLSPGDPVVLVSVGLTFVAVGALASYLPALRASRVNPLVALRDE
jgi:predicted permease